ncbi:hypothetical protein EV359DRAFT_69134 [Lentinula novae-zelandiae]|nr:hypothetical protein EV359DRAFT_69134 [Lentinula novae-zelandiae]
MVVLLGSVFRQLLMTSYHRMPQSGRRHCIKFGTETQRWLLRIYLDIQNLPMTYIHLDSNGKRHWADFMSGNFAWRQATCIYEDDLEDCTKGAMIVPIILGADKTTVSVATGHLIGSMTRTRCFTFSERNSTIRQLLSQGRHDKAGMTRPVVRRCPDGHFRQAIDELAAFIADYPEQVYLSGIVQGWCNALFSELDKGAGDCRTRKLDQILHEEYGGEGRTLWDNFGMDEHVIPFTEYFPRADIHMMLLPDLLHQIIKGCFKDTLVEWVMEYLTLEHGKGRANEILDDIDQHLAAFKQWTGDDSKALMKIFLSAIAEYLPEEMMKCLASFLDFYYLVRRSDIDKTFLKAIEKSIEMFNHYREIFKTSGNLLLQMVSVRQSLNPA